MAVGRSPRDELHSDDSVRATAVVDHHLLAEVLRELDREYASDEVVAPARNGADDETDRLPREGLRSAGDGRERAHQQHYRLQSHDLPWALRRPLSPQSPAYSAVSFAFTGCAPIQGWSAMSNRQFSGPLNLSERFGR